MNLMFTDKFDKHADVIEKKLLESSVDFIRINLDVESLSESRFSLSSSKIMLEQRGIKTNLNECRSVYFRRTFVELTLQEKDNQTTDFKLWKNEWNKSLLGIYTFLRNKKQLNNLKKAYQAENKFVQLHTAKVCGLSIPEYLVTNSLEEIEQFSDTHGEFVLKPMTQEFYQTNDGYKGLYVNKIDIEHLSANFSNSENPMFFQKYINKKYEVRYTVVGENHFPCLIDSQKSSVANVDWRRYDLPNTPHRRMDVPDSVRTKVNSLMKKLGLIYGALDFVVDENGNWYFLEVNPSGQWLWIESLTGFEISDSIVDWISKNS